MRIVAGTWRGRRLAAPPGSKTRPTADRVRQALFDMLVHAPWGGADAVSGARVLDVFAGTGALGLEALSRGAAHATFMEADRTALATLRANIAALAAGERATVLAGDALHCPVGAPAALVFLDPPYGEDLVSRAVDALRQAGWIGPKALLVGEIGREEAIPDLGERLADRAHGVARVVIWRAADRGDAGR
jgi:16S rRNA (guanine966-N2)-methyltransferase